MAIFLLPHHLVISFFWFSILLFHYDLGILPFLWDPVFRHFSNNSLFSDFSFDSAFTHFFLFNISPFFVNSTFRHFLVDLVFDFCHFLLVLAFGHFRVDLLFYDFWSETSLLRGQLFANETPREDRVRGIGGWVVGRSAVKGSWLSGSATVFYAVLKHYSCVSRVSAECHQNTAIWHDKIYVLFIDNFIKLKNYLLD